MDAKELKRLSEIANICRTENTQPELSSMLADLDSSLEDLLGRKKVNCAICNTKCEETCTIDEIDERGGHYTIEVCVVCKEKEHKPNIDWDFWLSGKNVKNRLLATDK